MSKIAAGIYMKMINMIELKDYGCRKLHQDGMYLVTLRGSFTNDVSIVYHKNDRFWILKCGYQGNYNGLLHWVEIVPILIDRICKMPESFEELLPSDDHAKDKSSDLSHTR